MYKRRVKQQVEEFLQDNGQKLLFMWGPRRSGKTTILEQISQERNAKIFNFDFVSDREYFINRREELSNLAKEQPLILIDEVQNYSESTISIKALIDNFNVKVIATGSSELKKTSQEYDSMAGRYNQIYCLPMSTEEFYNNNKPAVYDQKNYFKSLAYSQMIYGSYPEVSTLSQTDDKIKTLQRILDAYVLKDVIDIYNLKNTELAKNILTKIALQTGQEVSLTEISKSLGAPVSTISNYIEIFRKNYVLIALPAFKTNLRRALSEKKKYYFYDMGIRNALIKDFRDLDFRQDKGGVFENLVISEFEKRRLNEGLLQTMYFYREYSGKEVDLVVEDYKKNYECFEIKLTEQKTPPKIFPLPHKSSLINVDNFFKAILKSDGSIFTIPRS